MTKTSDVHIAIDQRIEHLQVIYVEAEKWAKKRGTVAFLLNISIIILSTFMACSQTTDTIFGASNRTILVIVSIVVAMLGAVQSTLKFERRSERASLLATSGRNLKYTFQSQLLKIAHLPKEEVREAELELFAEMNQQFEKMLKEATTLKMYPVLRFPSKPVIRRRENERR